MPRIAEQRTPMARTENLTIMFTDVVGYTQRTSGQSRTEIRALLKRCSSVLLPQVRRYGGWQVKNLGDAILVAFRSPTDAVRCGMALHDALAESNRMLPETEQLHIRVALALGEVLVQDNDVFGEAVNLAARLEEITPADGIYFTDAVYLAMNKAEVPSLLVGSKTFKGIPESVRVYQAPAGHVSRLVPAGEALTPALGDLPYGGMHRSHTEVGLRQRLRSQLREWHVRALTNTEWLPSIQRQGVTRTAITAIALLLLALVAFTFDLVRPMQSEAALAPALDTSSNLPALTAQHSLLREAQPWLAAGQYARVRTLYEAQLARAPNDPQALVLQGHDLFHSGDRPRGVAAYDRALKLDPALCEDPLLARNLVRGLSWAAPDAIRLIKRYTTPVMLEALTERTAQTGARGRERAADLLRELGQSQRVDRGGMALEDLREAQTCETKLPAVQQLRKLREKRALPDLRALTTGGLKGWWANRCLRSEAEAAIREMQNS